MISLIYIFIIFVFFLVFILLRISKSRKEYIEKKTDEPVVREFIKKLEKSDLKKIEDRMEVEKEIQRMEFEDRNKKQNKVEILDNYDTSEKKEEPFTPQEVKADNLLENEFEVIQDEVIQTEKPQPKEENEISPDELLNKFVNYINKNKLTKLDDLSTHLKSGKEETVDNLREIESHSNSVGFLDDTGFYMSLNELELEFLEKLLLLSKNKKVKISTKQLLDEFNKIVNQLN